MALHAVGKIDVGTGGSRLRVMQGQHPVGEEEDETGRGEAS